VKSTKQFIPLFALLALLALFVAACTGSPRFEPGAAPLEPTATAAPDRPVSSEDPTPEPGPTPDMEKVIVGEAMVEQVDVLILESFPVQIHALVTGYLGDGCTEVGEIRQWREGNTLYVTIGTVRPADAICTLALVGLETTVPLDVRGLPAGTYTVDVHGVTISFELNVDNVMAPDSGEATAAVEAARATLAQAEQIAENDIEVLEVTAVEWSNACLGAAVEDEMCAEVITPGYKVALEWGGLVYTYHTNWDGSQVRLAHNT
jgi:hypothetical protein